MVNKYQYFDGNEDKETVKSQMKKYGNIKHEIDKELEKIISPIIEKEELKILDACCGAGYLANALSEISSKSEFVGIDQTDYLIKDAQQSFKHKKNISFEVGDISEISKKYKKKFDISINWRTLSWLPYYDQMLKELFSVTKDHIFLSSLFYDGDIDFEIKVREYKKEKAKEGFNQFYNVYSYPRFEKFLYDLGAKSVKSFNFDIDIDLPKPPIDDMGTYTLKLDDGKRIQISGPIMMLWKIVQIDL